MYCHSQLTLNVGSIMWPHLPYEMHCGGGGGAQKLFHGFHKLYMWRCGYTIKSGLKVSKSGCILYAAQDTVKFL